MNGVSEGANWNTKAGMNDKGCISDVCLSRVSHERKKKRKCFLVCNQRRRDVICVFRFFFFNVRVLATTLQVAPIVVSR